MSANVKFTYLYRDGGNWKNWGEVIFSNNGAHAVSDIEGKVRHWIVEQEVFVAHQVRLCELFPAAQDLSIHDHCYHEFYSVETTLEPADDFWNRDISELLVEFQEVSRSGWGAFDIYERCRPQASYMPAGGIA